MGMSPAPPIANIYVALHKSKEIFPVFDNNLFFCVRLIDDGIVIWKHGSDPVSDAVNWRESERTTNKSGLNWTFMEPSKQVDFTDLTIKIEGQRITTNLFEEPLALHLYIPPCFCHPPSCVSIFVRAERYDIKILQTLQTLHLPKGYQTAAKEILWPSSRDRRY